MLRLTSALYERCNSITMFSTTARVIYILLPVVFVVGIFLCLSETHAHTRARDNQQSVYVFVLLTVSICYCTNVYIIYSMCVCVCVLYIHESLVVLCYVELRSHGYVYCADKNLLLPNCSPGSFSMHFIWLFMDGWNVLLIKPFAFFPKIIDFIVIIRDFFFARRMKKKSKQPYTRIHW